MALTNEFRERDYKKRPCPNCGQVGGIRLDFIASVFVCTHCGQSDIDPYGNRVLHGRKIGKNDAPDVPIRDIVEDTIKVVGPEGESEIVVSRYTLAKAPHDDTIFDPTAPITAFFLKCYRKRFASRRRLRNRHIKG